MSRSRKDMFRIINKRELIFRGFSSLTCFIKREAITSFRLRGKKSECEKGGLILCGHHLLRALRALVLLWALVFGVSDVYAAESGSNLISHSKRHKLNIPATNAAESLKLLAEQADVELLFLYHLR